MHIHIQYTSYNYDIPLIFQSSLPFFLCTTTTKTGGRKKQSKLSPTRREDIRNDRGRVSRWLSSALCYYGHLDEKQAGLSPARTADGQYVSVCCRGPRAQSP